MADRRREPATEFPVLALQRKAAARALGVGVDTFDRHIRPYVPVVYVGGVRLWRASDLDAWLRAHA